MKATTALTLVPLAAAIGLLCLPREPRQRLTSLAKHRLLKGMENMMANLPEGAPPKLVMSILPRLKAQNDQIIAMLQEQNELLRRRHDSADYTDRRVG